MVNIVQNGNKVLREVAKSVHISDIKTKEIEKILKDMSEALISQDDGVALAAPQIGISLRIFVVSGRIFDEDFISGKITSPLKVKHKDLVFINPVIKKISRDKKLMSEGCLSVRPLYGKVRRATRVTIEAYDENAKKFTREGTGLLAHIFQHETDHLDGVLFIDKAKDLQEVYPSNNNA